MVPCKSTPKKASFEWSRHGISSTDATVTATTHVYKIVSGREWVESFLGVYR